MQEVGGSIPPGSTTLRQTASRGAATEVTWRSVVPVMWYLYIIRSKAFPDQQYIGATSDLKKRIADQNAGRSAHTSKFKPWELIWYCAFQDKYKALAFETYLKSHSGHAFAKKRF